MNYPPSTHPISTDTVPAYQRQAPRTSWGAARNDFARDMKLVIFRRIVLFFGAGLIVTGLVALMSYVSR